jgi:uroporphyrin-III C-methyltransferase/precorrin-2 dehydrogenase/sirohydrochlorin ferrochelatase
MIVIAATDDIAINTAVWDAARERNILMNSVDDIPRCDFIAPAIARQGPIAVAISTNGTSPALAAHLRRQIETIMGPEIGILADVLGGMRPQVMAEVDGVGNRITFWKELVNDDLIELTRREGRDAAQAHVTQYLADWASRELVKEHV